MKRLLISICFFFVISLNAQNEFWEWAINPSQPNGQFVYKPDISVDPFGNVFVLSESRGIYSNPMLTNDSGAFIARYNQYGQLSWTKKIIGSPTAICADESGDVYVSGSHFTYNQTPTNSPGAFLAKYSSTGNLLWEYTSPNRYTQISAIALGVSGRIFVTGCKADVMVLGTFTLTGEHSLLLACFSPNGNVLWAKSGEVMNDTILYGWGNQIALDQYENVYTTYQRATCPNWSCGEGGFIKLDQNGNHITHKKFSGYNAVCNGIVVEPNGDVIASHCLSAWTSGGTYVLRRYKPDFSSYYWEKVVSEWQCRPLSMESRPAFTSNGDLFIAGGAGSQCNPTVQKIGFGTDTIVTDSLMDIVLARVDRTTGDYTGVWHIAGAMTDNIEQICTDKFGNCYAVGNFNLNYIYNSNKPCDTLCFDATCLGMSKPAKQLFVAKLRVSASLFPDGVDEVKNLALNLLSPNPTEGIIILKNDVRPEFIEVADINGRRCGHLAVGDDGRINFSEYPCGVYVFRVPTATGFVYEKVVKLR